MSRTEIGKRLDGAERALGTATRGRRPRAYSHRGEWVWALVFALVPTVVFAQPSSPSSATDSPCGSDRECAPNEPTDDDAAPSQNGSTDRGAPTAAARIEPPELLRFVEAVYPASAREVGFTGTVLLELVVDATGAVSDARVVNSVGHGLDEAALEAVRRFSFRPATRDGRAVAARIRYAYVFRSPEPIVPGDTAPPGDPPAASSEQATLPPTAGRLQPQPDQAVARPAERATVVTESGGTDSAATIDVVVEGETRGDRLRRSARAVAVVDTRAAQAQSADLGEVLARNNGIGVRRGGGAGSGTELSLNGLSGDQTPVFIDGLPLDIAGYPFGVSNVPVNLIERVEVYRGVVPVSFGADALGGALNLVTDEETHGSHGTVSYQDGSFGTRRATLTGRTRDADSGVMIRAAAFGDWVDNDYPVDVEVPDAEGQLSEARVYRFADRYRAVGGNLQAGVVDVPWATRLLLQGFAAAYDKQLQHNVVMTVPYGDVVYGGRTVGGNARYATSFAGRGFVEAIVGYSHSRTRFVDLGECVVDWFGQCVRARPQPGELESPGSDRAQTDDTGLARVNLGWSLGPEHSIRATIAPQASSRTGDERHQSDPTARDPLNSRRTLGTLVSGLEHQLELSDGRVQNILMVKDYLQSAHSEELQIGGMVVDRSRDTHRLGAGNSLRFHFADWGHAKASYELATRLPRPDEVFGDGVLITPNQDLAPELSHNANVGCTLELAPVAIGRMVVDFNAFVRDAERLIVLLGEDRSFSYQNVLSARSLGAEFAVSWASPQELIAVDTNATLMDFRNTSSEGTYGDFEGDRIPNVPYAFANGSLRLRFPAIAVPGDVLTLGWTSRYVHEFFRGWESIGRRDTKQTIPTQLVHGVALIYVVEGDPVTMSYSVEADNVTDARAYDYFGVQRPGRAAYFKVRLEL